WICQNYMNLVMMQSQRVKQRVQSMHLGVLNFCLEFRECCATFHSIFSHGDSLDVDLNDLFSKLKVLQFTLPNELMSATKILEFAKSADCYLNVSIAYKIFLMAPVTV
ncbi:hypothetical protein J1N35_029751, partial [Gossypium stocksii]